MLVGNKQLDLFIYEEGITFLIDKENSHKKYYGPVDLTGFDTSPLFKTPSNSIPENSSNKSSETVAKSEDMESIIDIRPEDIEQEDIEKECRGFEANKQAQNTLQEKKTTLENKPQDKPSVEEKKNSVFKENKTIIEEKPQEQPVVKNEVVDKKEVKPEAVSIAVNGADKKPIQEEITVRNSPVETPKEYPIETEFVDNKLNMDLIKHKEEEQNKKEKEEQKKKEEEQKKKETGSIIPALQYVDKAQTNEKSEEESGTFNLLSDRLRNKEKDNKERGPSSKEDNKDQEQETVKDSGLIKRKGRYK